MIERVLKLTPKQSNYIELLCSKFPSQFTRVLLIDGLKNIPTPQGRTTYLQNLANQATGGEIFSVIKSERILPVGPNRVNAEKSLQEFKINLELIPKKEIMNEKTFPLENKIKVFHLDNKFKKFDYVKDLIPFQQMVMSYIKAGQALRLEDIDFSSFKTLYGEKTCNFLKDQASILFEISATRSAPNFPSSCPGCQLPLTDFEKEGEQIIAIATNYSNFRKMIFRKVFHSTCYHFEGNVDPL